MRNSTGLDMVVPDSVPKSSGLEEGFRNSRSALSSQYKSSSITNTISKKQERTKNGWRENEGRERERIRKYTDRDRQRYNWVQIVALPSVSSCGLDLIESSSMLLVANDNESDNVLRRSPEGSQT